MIRTLALLTLLGLGAAVVAAPPVTAPEIAPAPRIVAAKAMPFKVADTQEVVVFTPNRPVRVRLTIQLDNRSVGEMWGEKLRVAFDHFDRNKDGSLNEVEVANIFSDTGLTQMLQNGFYQPTPNDRPALDRLDKDGDRKVSFDEYAAYYRGATSMLMRPQPVAAADPQGAAATEALFKLMDANGDAKLTRDEVKAIERFVASKDADEDECLSLAELIPNFNDPRLVRQLGQAGGGIGTNPTTRVTTPQVVFTYEAGRIPGTLTQQLIKQYDKNGDYDLSREEVAFDAVTFSRLDRDGNGKLDGEELDAWRTGTADLDVTLSMASKAVDCVAKVTTDPKVVTERGFVVKQVESGRLVARVDRQPIEFWAYANVLNYQQPALKTQYAYLFTQAAGAKDHVLEKDLSGPNAVQFQFLRTMFDAADANGDGKLTKAEFDGYFDLQESFRNVALAVTPAVQTPTLFQLLDENRDGRLSVRELRTAWDRLVPLEPPGSGDVITRAAIQPSVSLRLSRALERFYVAQPQLVYQNPNQQVVVPQKGPLWFRRMDRNADGDVSRSEFLGSKAEFDAIDANHDDLISLEEAEAWDKKMREKDEKK